MLHFSNPESDTKAGALVDEGAPKPAQPKTRPGRTKPAPVVEQDDSAAFGPQPLPPVGINPIPRVPVVHGVDAEADSELIQARAKFDRIAERHRVVATQLAAARAKCGLRQGDPLPNPRKLPKAIADAILGGCDSLSSDDFAALAGIDLAEKSLRAAAEKAADEVIAMRFSACTRCGPRVLAAVKPEMDALREALLDAIRKQRALDAKLDEFRGAGWYAGRHNSMPSLPLERYRIGGELDARIVARELFQTGLFSRKEVAEAFGLDPKTLN